MEFRKYRLFVIAAMILTLAAMTAWAQTGTQAPQIVTKELKVMEHNGGFAWTASGDPQAHVSTFTFVASEMGFESKVVKGVPFSADTVTEFAQTLPNGQRLYRKSTSSIARDSEGRTRREQTVGAIGTYAAEGPAHQTIFINDPVSGTVYTLNPQDHTATMIKVPTGAPGEAKVITATAVAHAGESGNVVTYTTSSGGVAGGVAGGVSGGVMGGGVVSTPFGVVTKIIDTSEHSHATRTEPLGTQIIDGVSAEGKRTIETIPAGSIGNDTPIEIVSESWYSKDLGMVIKTIRRDPLTGDNTYQLVNIKLGEPSPALFQVPPEYSVKEGNVKFQFIKK